MSSKWNTRQILTQQRKRASAAVFLASQIMVKEIKKRTPVDTGNLKTNTTAEKINAMKYRITNNTEYASAVEFGTRPHEIKIKHKKVLTDGKTFFGKKVQHPGTKAQPFMRPGYRASIKSIKALLKRI